MSRTNAGYPFPREYECDGTHASRNGHVVDVSWEKVPGLRLTCSMTMEVCADPCCARLFATCDHNRCTWDLTGQVLSCDFCGIDGT